MSGPRTIVSQSSHVGMQIDEASGMLVMRRCADALVWSGDESELIAAANALAIATREREVLLDVLGEANKNAILDGLARILGRHCTPGLVDDKDHNLYWDVSDLAVSTPWRSHLATTKAIAKTTQPKARNNASLKLSDSDDSSSYSPTSPDFDVVLSRLRSPLTLTLLASLRNLAMVPPNRAIVAHHDHVLEVVVAMLHPSLLASPSAALCIDIVASVARHIEFGGAYLEDPAWVPLVSCSHTDPFLKEDRRARLGLAAIANKYHRSQRAFDGRAPGSILRKRRTAFKLFAVLRAAAAYAATPERDAFVVSLDDDDDDGDGDDDDDDDDDEAADNDEIAQQQSESISLKDKKQKKKEKRMKKNDHDVSNDKRIDIGEEKDDDQSKEVKDKPRTMEKKQEADTPGERGKQEMLSTTESSALSSSSSSSSNNNSKKRRRHAPKSRVQRFSVMDTREATWIEIAAHKRHLALRTFEALGSIKNSEANSDLLASTPKDLITGAVRVLAASNGTRPDADLRLFALEFLNLLVEVPPPGAVFLVGASSSPAANAVAHHPHLADLCLATLIATHVKYASAPPTYLATSDLSPAGTAVGGLSLGNSSAGKHQQSQQPGSQHMPQQHPTVAIAPGSSTTPGNNGRFGDVRLPVLSSVLQDNYSSDLRPTRNQTSMVLGKAALGIFAGLDLEPDQLIAAPHSPAQSASGFSSGRGVFLPTDDHRKQHDDHPLAPARSHRAETLRLVTALLANLNLHLDLEGKQTLHEKAQPTLLLAAANDDALADLLFNRFI